MTSNKKSVILRKEGSKLNDQRSFHENLLMCNESLCHAESNKQLALAYADRSALYFEMKLYQHCLNNIRLAKEHNYPRDKLPTLHDRETRCLELMIEATSIESEAAEFLKLSYPANPKIPFIIDDLELKTNAKYGRHIITKRDLKVGDIISIESAFFKNLQSDPRFDKFARPSSKFNYCQRCLEDNELDLIPCKGCKAAMFCSDICDKSAQFHHKYECKNSEIVQSYRYLINEYRSFFKALAIMDGSIEELEKLFKECLKSPKTIFDFDLSDPSHSEYEKNKLRACLSLSRDSRVIADVQLDDLITLCPQQKNTWKLHEKFIHEFILHLRQVNQICLGDVNRYVKSKANQLGIERVLSGVGNYLFGTLINHSCWPNIDSWYVGTKIIKYVIRPIGAGQQLFSNYGNLFYKTPIEDRQENLLSYYGFVCDCEACKNGYILIRGMSTRDFDMETSKIVENIKVLKEEMQGDYEENPFPTVDYVMHVNFLSNLLFSISLRT